MSLADVRRGVPGRSKIADVKANTILIAGGQVRRYRPLVENAAHRAVVMSRDSGVLIAGIFWSMACDPGSLVEGRVVSVPMLVRGIS